MILGLSLLLFTSHAMGVFGWLTGNTTGTPLRAALPILIGLVLLADQLARGSLRPERWPVLPCWGAVCAAPLALLLVAASSPPGWLWESEFGAYDAMSYHLQLPKEWAMPAPEGVGRLWPVQHNVYSFLPSYFESAFLHLGALTPTWPSIGTGEGLSASERLVGGEGIWIISCQMLHVLFGCITAGLIGRCVAAIIDRFEIVAKVQRQTSNLQIVCAALGAGVCLSTPWLIVTGSLAYNELAMLALLAGAALIAIESDQHNESQTPTTVSRSLSPWARGIVAGWIVGIACSVKPTALLFGAPMIGLLLLAFQPRTRWLPIIVGGSVAGLLAMAPWLLRNELATGNPVFPFAAKLFGTGHWTAEQVAVYALNHGPEGSLADRLSLLFSSGRAASGDAASQAPIHARGLRHEQWAWVPAIALIACIVTIAFRPTRRIGTVLAISMATQLIAWLFFTHLQSRFLLPMLIPMSLAIGLGGATLIRLLAPKGQPSGPVVPKPVALALMLIPIATCAWSTVIFLAQHRQEPNGRLVGGPGIATGGSMEAGLMALTPDERAMWLTQRLGPESFVNLALHPGLVMPELFSSTSSSARPQDEPSFSPRAADHTIPGKLYLLGDSAPLYFIDAVGGPNTPVIYHTAWDRSPLGDAIRAALDSADGHEWTASLRAQGIEFVLVNYNELGRLIEASGYYDKAVTIARVKQWLPAADNENPALRGIVPVRLWPEQSRALFRLTDPSALTPTETTR